VHAESVEEGAGDEGEAVREEEQMKLYPTSDHGVRDARRDGIEREVPESLHRE
jgi:hypothetical protein